MDELDLLTEANKLGGGDQLQPLDALGLGDLNGVIGPDGIVRSDGTIVHPQHIDPNDKSCHVKWAPREIIPLAIPDQCEKG